LEKACRQGGDRPALRWKPGCEGPERVVSFTELRGKADALGRRLLALGLARGERVALLSENRPEWCISYLAVAAAGLVIVPLDVSLDDEGVRRNLRAARCRVLLTSERQCKRHPPLEKGGGAGALGLELVVDFDLPEGKSAPLFESFSAALELGSGLVGSDLPGSPCLPRPGEIGPEAPAVVFFTSGTTGIAKGIVLSHKAVIANVNAARMSLIVDESDVFVALLPLHHTYATTCSFLSSVEAGSSVVIVDRFAPSAVLRMLGEGGVTFLIGVPLLFDKLEAGIEAKIKAAPGFARLLVRGGLTLSRFSALRLHLPIGRLLFKPLRKKAGMASVRLAVSGGGPLSPETADFFDALGVPIVQGYGMSENGPLISVNLPERKNNRSVGFPVKYTELRIAAPGPDGVGEIEVRGPSLMLGYLDAPEATSEVFTRDGWLRTGDLGRVDGRGFVYITGRRKNLIITEGGKNVYPEEIEERLQASAWIKEVLVVGRPVAPGHAGEDVVAILVPDSDKVAAAYPGRESEDAFVADLLKTDVLRINKGLPAFMKISDIVVRSEDFEKTSSGKIRRFLYAEYARR
jgi:long-chain acyl-CoA synthetase